VTEKAARRDYAIVDSVPRGEIREKNRDAAWLVDKNV